MLEIYIDYIVVFLISCFIFAGIFRGFIQEILSLIIWIMTFYFTRFYYSKLAIYFVFIDKQSIKNTISIIILSLIIFIIGSLIRKYVYIIIKHVDISFYNRIFGGIFGFIKSIFILFLIISILNNFIQVKDEKFWKHSTIIPKLYIFGEIFYEKIKILYYRYS